MSTTPFSKLVRERGGTVWIRATEALPGQWHVDAGTDERLGLRLTACNSTYQPTVKLDTRFTDPSPGERRCPVCQGAHARGEA